MHNLKFVFWSVLLLTVGSLAQSLPTATLTATDGVRGSQLGYSVAMSGSIVAAGAPGAVVNGKNQGAVYVFTKNAASPWADMTESAKLVRLNGQSGDSLGTFVAMSGDGSVIVSSSPDGADIFVKPASGWQGTVNPVAILSPGPPPKSWVVIGNLTAVAINATGNTIVAGAFGAGTVTHRSGGKEIAAVPEQGAAFVWVEPSGGWAAANATTETAELTASDGVAFDHFGWAVGVSANTIVAGAPSQEDGSTRSQGAAYLFIRPSTGLWHDSSKFSSKFTASDAAINDGFGFSVAAGNSSSLIAVASARGCGSSPGAAYVFARPSTWWPAATTQTAEFTPSDSSGACFGLNVTVANPAVIVGAPSALCGAGAAYMFAKQAKGWTNLSVPASTVGGGESFAFGNSNSIAGPSTAAGSPGTTVNGTQGAGAVYVFVN